MIVILTRLAVAVDTGQASSKLRREHRSHGCCRGTCIEIHDPRPAAAPCPGEATATSAVISIHYVEAVLTDEVAWQIYQSFSSPILEN